MFKGFLTIGIPSVRRPNDDDYLMHTLVDLVDKTLPSEREDIVVLIFLSDQNTTYNEHIYEKIKLQFGKFIQSELFHIIQASPKFYPSLEGLGTKFNDSVERTKWRSKQSADFAFMFSYASDMSRYYIQIEDDVICQPGFVSQIKSEMISKYNNSHSERWGVVSFSSLGFIGKLMRSKDLKQISSFFVLFYSDMPVDWLILEYLKIKDQIFVKSSLHLFQHIGKYSSLENKIQMLIDKAFPADHSSPHVSKNPTDLITDMNDNIKADLSTSMGSSDTYHSVKFFYYSQTGFYWANAVRSHSSIYIIFDTPQVLTSVSITTGSPFHPGDILQKGSLYGGRKANEMVMRPDKIISKIKCGDELLLGKFENGNINVTLNHGTLFACLRIAANVDHVNWVLFNNIHLSSLSLTTTTRTPKVSRPPSFKEKLEQEKHRRVRLG